MSSSDLGESLNDIVVKRKQGEGEFCYVYLPSGETIAGKKAAFRAIKSDEALFDNLKDSCKLASENDAAFEARVLRLLVSVPFEGEAVTTARTPSKQAPEAQNKKFPASRPGNVQYIFFETEFLAIHTDRKVQSLKQILHMTQIGAASETPKKFFKPIVDDAVNKASDSVLEKLHMTKNGKFNFTYKRFSNEVPCSKDLAAIDEFLKFIESETVRDKTNKVCLVSYRRDNFARLLYHIDRHQRRMPFRKVVDAVVFLEDVFDEKPLKQYLPLKSLAEFYKKTTGLNFNLKTPNAEDLAELVQRSSQKLMNQHNFSLMDFAKTVQTNEFWKDLKRLFPCNFEMPANMFSVTNSLNFHLKEKFPDSGSAAVTTPAKTILKDAGPKKVLQAKIGLENLIARRRLEGGEFSYVYIPLEKVISGKKAMYNYLKNQHEEFSKLKKSCQNSEETDDAFDNRMMKEMLTVPYEKDIIATPMDTDNDVELPTPKRKSNLDRIAEEKKKLKLDPKAAGSITDSRPSTSKVGSRPPQKKPSPPQKKTSPEIIEMDIDEDNFEFATVGQEIVYQVLCQPVLMKLGTVDENTKFIKFSLNPQMRKRANATKIEMLNNSSKVFWRKDTPYAFCNLCPELENDIKYKPAKAKIVDTLPSDQIMGSFKALNRTDEEQRNLSTKVLVDIVVTKAGNDNTKVNVGKEPVSVLVKLLLKPGSLTDGDIHDFEFRPSDVIICHQSTVKNLSIVSKFISVDRKQGVANRAKIVVKAGGHQLLSEGQVLATGTLFQNDVKLVFQTLDLQTATNTDIRSSSNAALMQVQHKAKRPLKTMGASRLYAQGVNPVLVKLDQYESTRLTSKFAKAYIEYSVEFNEIIDQNRQLLKIEKMTEKDKIVRVFWNGNIPYAFVNINIPPVKNQVKVDFCDIIQNYEIGTFAPLEMGDPAPANKVSMHLCVDFEKEKNCMVENIPTLINVYLKFKDAEIDKKEVLEQYFAVTKTHHRRIEILSVVIKPDAASKLAPQKTSTNDMKATLLVKSVDENPVMLNAREVVAECDSMDPDHNINR